MEKFDEFIKNNNITALAIDSHAHLETLKNKVEIIEQMQSQGLKKIVLIATSLKVVKWVEKLARENKNLFFIAGLHPYDIHNYNEEFVEYLKNLKETNPKFVGIGEIGLDYHPHENMHSKEFQKEIFARQIVLADELKLPISLHIRDAHANSIKLLNEYKKYLNNGGIIHCCSADASEVREYLSLGFHISFSGVITYKKSSMPNYLEETLKKVPLDRLLIETDSPYLRPAPFRGGINEPKYVRVTALEVAKILNMDVNEVIDITIKNAEKLLKI